MNKRKCLDCRKPGADRMVAVSDGQMRGPLCDKCAEKRGAKPLTKSPVGGTSPAAKASLLDELQWMHRAGKLRYATQPEDER